MFLNIGNSRAILGKTFKSEEGIHPFQVTHDHTLARFDERQRILASEGKVEQFRNEKGEKIGPERIWAKNEKYPGIFVTRVLGLTCSNHLGIICEP